MMDKNNKPPISMVYAKQVTELEVVTEKNIEQLKKAVANGKDVYPGANSIVKATTGTIIMLTGSVRPTIELGDTVNRHLLNGDKVLFNRQPKLNRHSMMACKLIIDE